MDSEQQAPSGALYREKQQFKRNYALIVGLTTTACVFLVVIVVMACVWGLSPPNNLQTPKPVAQIAEPENPKPAEPEPAIVIEHPSLISGYYTIQDVNGTDFLYISCYSYSKSELSCLCSSSTSPHKFVLEFSSEPNVSTIKDDIAKQYLFVNNKDYINLTSKQNDATLWEFVIIAQLSDKTNLVRIQNRSTKKFMRPNLNKNINNSLNAVIKPISVDLDATTIESLGSSESETGMFILRRQ